ncbi:MAG: hypothetical protein Q7S75_03000 [bacterium]|nr:hypothetical protein [bacterium]
MNTKKIVLWAGVGALLLIILIAVIQDKSYGACSFKTFERIHPNWVYTPDGNSVYQPEISWDRIDLCEQLAFALIPLLPLLLLSLITYKMKDEVFRAWWNFARWWVPLIIIVTILLENAGGGGTLGMDKDFTAFILIILYSVLVIVSLVKIVRAYLKTRGA